MISPFSSFDTSPSYNILVLVNVTNIFADSIPQSVASMMHQWCILRFSFPLTLVSIWWWLFPLFFQWHRSLQILRRFYIFLFCSLSSCICFFKLYYVGSRILWLVKLFTLAFLLNFLLLVILIPKYLKAVTWSTFLMHIASF